MNETEKAAEDLVTIAGGVEIEVNYQNNGAGEKVKVRQIPISKLQEFLFAMGNEAASIELYCDKPKGWADTLTVESANAIANKGQEINLPFLGAWWRRQAKWREMQLSSMGDTGKVKTAGLSESVSPASAPVSPTTTT